MLNSLPQTRVATFGAVLSVLVLAACDGGVGQTLPDGVSEADVALFKSAVAAEGCTVANDTQGDAVQAATGFDDDKLSIITQYLTLAGESEPAVRGFRLTSGPCANA